MDPDATWAIVTDETYDLSARAAAATDLLVWIAADGALPSRVDGYMRHAKVGGSMSVAVLRRVRVVDECKTVIFHALDRLEELEEETTDREARVAESRLRHPSRA